MSVYKYINNSGSTISTTNYSILDTDFIQITSRPTELESYVNAGLDLYKDGVEQNNFVEAAKDGAALLYGGATHNSPSIIAFPYNSDGIDAAIAKIVASGKPGTITYAATDYTITRSHTLVSNVSHVGILPKMVFTANVPDAEFSTSGGTRFIIAAGITAFVYNNVDKGSDETNIALFSLSNCNISNITFVGGTKAIDIGAYRAMGCVWSQFKNLYAFDQTSDYAFDFKNFQHCDFDRLYTSSQLTSGSGIRFASMLSSTLLPGNSEIGEVYTYCKNRLNRSIVIEASGPSGCILNQIKVRGRLQGNRYGAATPDSISMAFTNASSAVTVADNTQYALCQIGVPIVFDTTAPGAFGTSTAYFVLSRGASNTITLAETPYDTSPIVATSTASFTAKTSGYPAIQVWATNGNSVKNSDFGQIDAESAFNVVNIVIAKTRGSKFYFAEMSTSATGTALVARDAECAISYGGSSTFTQDQSSLYGFMSVRNEAGGPYQYSGGSITVDSSWNDRKIRYSGTADITITLAASLPKDFKLLLQPTGATGVVTFVGPSGGAIFSKAGLRTNGQYATVRLQNTANRVYALSGDTQV